jgi:hypothetical protein
MLPVGAARFSAGAVGDVGDVTEGTDGDVLGASPGLDVCAMAAELAKRAAIATAGRSLLMMFLLHCCGDTRTKDAVSRMA